MEQYIDLSPGAQTLNGGVEIAFEYTAQDGRLIQGGNLSMALELFACLDLESLPPANLKAPYKLTITCAPS